MCGSVWKCLIYISTLYWSRLYICLMSGYLGSSTVSQGAERAWCRLHSTRDTIPDAPAVYFGLPSDENIQRICQDLSSHMYGSYNYNFFILPVSRTKLEDMATAVLQAGSENLVQRLFDLYTNFICLESNMFFLKQPSDSNISYIQLKTDGWKCCGSCGCQA